MKRKKRASSGDDNEQELTPEQIRELVQRLDRVVRIMAAMEKYIVLLAQEENYGGKDDTQDE